MSHNEFPDDNHVVSQSGAQFFEGVRDDINLIFSRDQGAASIARLIDVGSSSHAVTHDTTEGRAVFDIDSTPGAVCYHESDKKAKYESGHMILGGQTIEPSVQPIGDGKIEWGFGENDGAGDILNAIGMGYDAIGTYCFRKKNGSYVHKVYENSPLNSTDGLVWENPISAFDILKNNIMGPAFEWYGVASPQFIIADEYGFPKTIHVSKTAGRINGTTVPEPRMPMFLRVQGDSTTGQAISVSSGCWRGGVLTNKVALTAQRPDLENVDLRAGGDVADNATTTPLIANATYTPGEWTDLDQIVAVSCLIVANVGSASGGVQFQFRRPDSANPDARPTSGDAAHYIAQRTYTAIGSGQAFRVDKPAARWGRVVYVNGSSAQSSFQLNMNLETSSLATTVQVEPPETGYIQTITIGTSAQQLDSTALIGRLSWEVYSWATNANNQRIYVGFDNTVTLPAGANPGRPVENGGDWQVDASLNKQVWAIASQAGMVLTFTQLGK